MPLYTYQCENCGVVFERQQKFDDKPIKRCPECNKSTVRRVIQPAGIIFKGSGWYKTDSRSSSSSTISSGSSNKNNKKSEAKSEGGSSDSKPSESKTESKASESKTSSSSGE